MLVKLPKQPFNVTTSTLLSRIKYFLPEFITFSLYGKLLKMCPKMADESFLRGAKPGWLPQR